MVVLPAQGPGEEQNGAQYFCRHRSIVICALYSTSSKHYFIDHPPVGSMLCVQAGEIRNRRFAHHQLIRCRPLPRHIVFLEGPVENWTPYKFASSRSRTSFLNSATQGAYRQQPSLFLLISHLSSSLIPRQKNSLGTRLSSQTLRKGTRHVLTQNI